MRYCVFFFKQKTAYEITRRDWSSDVCSSDLLRRRPQCRCCGDPWQVVWRSVRPVALQPAKKATTGGGGHRTATPSQMLERHRHLVSPVTGIVKEIQPDPAAPAFANAYRSGPNIARGVTAMA